MSRIVISGASGDLGRRVTRLLLEADPGIELALVTRTPEKLADRAAQGVTVMKGDYRDRESLDAAYSGAETLLLISGLNLGRRISEHRNAIAAAQQAGIRHIVYTSVGGGEQPNNPALSAKDHKTTEQDLRSSGIAYTLLRNHLYAEIVSNVWIAPATASGRLEMATGQGSLAPVAKGDVARSAAAVLRDPERHASGAYEITGPELLSMQDIVRIGSEVHGVPITYVPQTGEQRLAFFDSVGLPRTYDPAMPPSPDGHMWASDELVSADLAVAGGYQALLTQHVKQITGRDPEPLRSVMERVKSVPYDQIDDAV
ncbi:MULTISPECIES: NmrA family NAD(P)-binding protein [unclassified Streptomyces]|uniref:NmrA family NAD(P)-binding protein n=1 Tax=unclassified Streptomyces TaxID=2593676 RepID=UPI002252B77D|nr:MULTISPECIES: NmrA family NAD(P)-binding protein [unclassified Streptomyces]MCX4642027.1 NmrA family NAD(P)-binding protein [Streptomyces sp. NBC_01446]MCX5085759.1 NmrA family NAD(P)-binding protein [Streptomyces sp. NBC_00401]MCX5326900.1 NmrA family NAD(P)-binding protein [Streptomyces sp. NBC_00120]